MLLPKVKTFQVGAFICALSLSLQASKAHAWVSDNVSPSSLGAIEVEIIDDAEDGCWTNIGESKAYAKDKLELLGYEVVSKWSLGDATFSISVLSERMIDGNSCYGSITVDLYIAQTAGRVFGYHKVGSNNFVFIRSSNANNLILNRIKGMIDEMREKQR